MAHTEQTTQYNTPQEPIEQEQQAAKEEIGIYIKDLHPDIRARIMVLIDVIVDCELDLDWHART